MRERIVEKENIGIQAARFSLYSPLAVMLVSCAINSQRTSGVTSAKDNAGTLLALAWLNIAIIVAGFVLGIFALIAMSRFGKKGILWRSITGVAVNGVLVVLMVSLFWPMLARRAWPAKLVGAWHMTSGPALKPNQTMDISFAADKTFTFDVTVPPVKAQITGTYEFTTGDQLLAITITDVKDGDRTTIGQRMLLGRIVELNDNHMRLTAANGEERYDRN